MLVVYSMGVLKHFELYQVFMLSWFKCFETFWDRKLCMNFLTNFFI